MNIGMSENEILEKLYSALSDWIHDVRNLESQGQLKERGLTLTGYLNDCLDKARQERRVLDCSKETMYKLLRGNTGPELLLFFCKKCPHYIDAFMRCEIPPYPWGKSSDVIAKSRDLLNSHQIQIQFGFSPTDLTRLSKEGKLKRYPNTNTNDQFRYLYDVEELNHVTVPKGKAKPSLRKKN